jgi:hypothetical protein
MLKVGAALIAVLVLSGTGQASAQEWRGDGSAPAERRLEAVEPMKVERLMAARQEAATRAQPMHAMAMQEQIGLFSRLLGLINDVTGMARDPSTAGVAAVMTAKDILGGPQDVVEYYETLLPRTKNPVIVRVLHLQLAEQYKAMGQRDKALDHLAVLITADPADTKR